VEQNGYLYRLTPNKQMWNESREVCQSYGGDLAYQAVKNNDSRMYELLFTYTVIYDELTFYYYR